MRGDQVEEAVLTQLSLDGSCLLLAFSAFSSCIVPGSNVAALQTEAVLDMMTDEWVIHTPDEGAIKWWIG